MPWFYFSIHLLIPIVLLYTKELHKGKSFFFCVSFKFTFIVCHWVLPCFTFANVVYADTLAGWLGNLQQATFFSVLFVFYSGIFRKRKWGDTIFYTYSLTLSACSHFAVVDTQNLKTISQDKAKANRDFGPVVFMPFVSILCICDYISYVTSSSKSTCIRLCVNAIGVRENLIRSRRRWQMKFCRNVAKPF